MLLGKRPRGPMRRTTSMTELGPELGGPAEGDAQQRGEWMGSGYAAAVATPRGGGGQQRRTSTGFVVDTAPFLKACGLCRRRLGPGRDIFMYRGDIAFCSLECRQQQMNQDERKEKYSLLTKKDAPPVTSGAESSGNGETMTVVI